MTHLYVTFENGATVDLGAAHTPHDAIGASRALLAASDDVAYLEWRDGDYVAFTATRISVARPFNGKPATFGWRSSSMAGHAFGELA